MRDEVVVDDAIGGKQQLRDDEAIAKLAERQYGVVARSQLLAAGVGARAIDHRLQRKRLHPLHRGIYAVGQRQLRKEAKWMAAVLACGPAGC